MVPVALSQRFLPIPQQMPAAAAAGGACFPHGGLVALPGQPGIMAALPAVVPLGLLGMVGMAGKAGVEGKAACKAGGRPAPSSQRQATNREAQKRYR